MRLIVERLPDLITSILVWPLAMIIKYPAEVIIVCVCIILAWHYSKKCAKVTYTAVVKPKRKKRTKKTATKKKAPTKPVVTEYSEEFKLPTNPFE